MAVEILWDPVQQTAAMWDNTTDVAFGPVFSGPSANVELQEFLDWHAVHGLWNDVRQYRPGELEKVVRRWCDLPTMDRS